MTKGLTLSSFGLIWLTLIVLSFGQILIKMGVGSEKIPVSNNPVRMVLNILRTVFRPKTLAGFFLYVVGTFIWLMVLSRVSLSIAFPLFSMSYFLVVILSATILHERVEWRFAITGLVLISVGVTFIGLSSPSKEGKVESGKWKARIARHADPAEAAQLHNTRHAELVEASQQH
jgi:drug/metabolite transporter (DMT)-like permease